MMLIASYEYVNNFNICNVKIYINNIADEIQIKEERRKKGRIESAKEISRSYK